MIFGRFMCAPGCCCLLRKCVACVGLIAVLYSTKRDRENKPTTYIWTDLKTTVLFAHFGSRYNNIIPKRPLKVPWHAARARIGQVKFKRSKCSYRIVEENYRECALSVASYSSESVAFKVIRVYFFLFCCVTLEAHSNCGALLALASA